MPQAHRRAPTPTAGDPRWTRPGQPAHRADLIGHQSGIVTHTTVPSSPESNAPRLPPTTSAPTGPRHPHARIPRHDVHQRRRRAKGVLEAFGRRPRRPHGNRQRRPLPEPDGAQFARKRHLADLDRRTHLRHRARHRYSDAQRRTIYWADVHMGPVTWRIIDHVGYSSLISALRTAHKTAVAAFPDGAKYRKDPTKVDAER
ncbi:hypothetical protein GS444_06105 [Rhodococcus hoagii]|nr:hypothetical protein [Prescottella equi]